MEKNILLVDDQRDILRLLRSTLETLKNDSINIHETISGEEALIESTRFKVDLLITDYRLPGMSGVKLMHKVRARHPDAQVIFITGTTERDMREEMINAGALAIFDKPIPLADFLDMAERGLGLVQTIFPPELESEKTSDAPHARLSDLLANFRQDVNADAVFLLNEKGLIQARTGKLRDESMEVSLVSTLMSIHSSSLKVARHNHQETLDSFHVFSGGDHDLLFIPVTHLFALLVAGTGLASNDHILESVGSLLALRKEVEKSLKSMGVTGELKLPAEEKRANPAEEPKASVPKIQTDQLKKIAPAPEMEQLLEQATTQKSKAEDPDDYWNDAAQKHGRKPTSPDVMSIEDARKMGILPDGE